MPQVWGGDKILDKSEDVAKILLSAAYSAEMYKVLSIASARLSP